MIDDSRKIEDFRVLLVGLGNVGFLYDIRNAAGCLTHVKGLQQASLVYGIRLELVALEQSLEKRELFMQKFPDSCAYSKVEDLPEISYNLIILACTTNQISRMYYELQKKVKCSYYLFEKPLCNDLDSLHDLESRIRTDEEIRVGFPRRSLPSTQYLRELIRNRYAEHEWVVKVSIGGDFLNIGSHFLDLIYYILGEFELDDFTKFNTLVRFSGQGQRFSLEGHQFSHTNTESTQIEFRGPVNVNYSKAGRLISFNTLRNSGEFALDTSYEIQNMIGFEALDYSGWALKKGFSSLATIRDNPIWEMLKVLKEV